jgi:hypothetical protein
MRYGNAAFLAEGTVLDLTARGWRMAGTMPVLPGMWVTVQVSIPERPTLLRVQRATVLWVKDHEFAIEVHHMDPMDQAWVSEFLHQKLGLEWISRTTHPEPEPSPTTQPARPPRGIPSFEDILHHLLDLQTDPTNKLADTPWDGDSDSEEGGSEALRDGVPEKLWHEAHRILRMMIALNESCARTSWDPIPDN